MAQKKQYRDFKEYLYEKLQEPKEALAYLNAALKDEDDRVFLLALKDVLEARGGDISDLADMTKLDRVNLYRILSLKGNPRWSSIKAIIHALNLNLSVNPAQN
jgi:probable addiction module antidote protein